MKGAVWKMPELEEYTNDIENLQKLADINTMPYGKDLKTIAYHPMDSTKAVSVVDNRFILWDIAKTGAQVTTDFLILQTTSSFSIYYPL